ncbi:MAG: Crossover junction endodeoxyribonuclease RuvC [Verrucomicrobia subdivision 3 bacterium]|nr:Crossover junction endodeoxyribonuclease RuvC [Limisphaerales bacterium]MCS1413850.1 Crossover junction endodeoxyribonuclease RuvC [Limisphaerales bacterium]
MGISPKAFAEMSQRLNHPTHADDEPVQSHTTHKAKAPISILGIDPSLRGTGFGVIRSLGQQLTYIDAGTIKCPPKRSHSKCLLEISKTLNDVIERCHPEVCVVEGLFFAKNLKTALIMGQVRGACIVTATRAELPIYEIAARKVKQAIVGFGGAQKLAVAKMVERMLSLDHTPSPDAADALALALAFTLESQSKIAKPIDQI